MSRMATLDAFREGRLTLLAASDVAARGLDIPDVSHIFNFDVPWQSDDYVHRIGRTGRAGKEGRSLTLVTSDDAKQLKDIERMLGAPVAWIGDPPNEEDLVSRRGRGRGRGGRASAGGREARGGRGRERGGPHRSERNGAHRPESNGAHAPGVHNGHNGHHEPQPAQALPRDSEPPRERPRREQNGSRPQRGEGRPPQQAKQPRQPKPQRQPWEPRPPRPERSREDRGPSPVGLGDHVPAFLKKTTRTAP
jgi:superfamily II DNA/RNA helicase